MTATFGDLVLAGRGHFDAAFTAWENDRSTENTAAIIRSIHRAAKTMSRCVLDIIADLPGPSVMHPEATPWRRAAAEANSCLTSAVIDLTVTVQQFGRLGSRVFSVPAGHASQAADALAAARDLLWSHHVTRRDDDRVPSDWSAAITSPTFSAALLTEIAGWCHQVSTWLSQKIPANTAPPDSNQDLCPRACQGLQAAATAITTASRRDPVAPAVRELLLSIPSAALPARHPPNGRESIGELCGGVGISAQRVRAAGRRAAQQARWSPDITADSWQWTAGAAAIISHISSLLLGTVALRDDLARMFPLSEPRLRAAAQAAARSHACWQQAASSWDVITTETQGLTSPVIADMTDLLLRIGRITFDHPRWTPERKHQAPVRQPDDLADGLAQLAAVVTATHEAADALACLATTDRQAVETANRAGRLHVPTRYLADEYDIPYSYARALGKQAGRVLNAYDAAVAASTYTAMMLEDLVLCIDAPSGPLATARRLARVADPDRMPAHELRRCAQLQPPGRNLAGPRTPGPVEKKLITLGVSEPFTLLQAAAIDHAGRELIATAGQTAKAAPPPLRHPASGALQPPGRHKAQSQAACQERRAVGDSPAARSTLPVVKGRLRLVALPADSQS